MTAQAPDSAAPFCARSRDVGTNRGAVEHLHEAGCSAEFSQRLEEGLKNAAAAQPRKPLPDGVPVPIFSRKCPPGHVLQREEVQRLKKAAIIASFVATTRQTPAKYLQNDLPIIFRQPRQHRPGPDLPDSL